MTERSLSLVFFGTPDFALESLKAITASRHKVLAVVCQPDKRSGRGRKKLEIPPVKLFAQEMNLPVLQPESAKDEHFLETLESFQAEAFCVAAYGMILPRRLIDMPPLGTYNAHGSLLPRWRGAAPINQSILSGDTETGITIQKVAFKLDSGDILLQQSTPISQDDTAATLRARLAGIAGECFVEALNRLAEGTATLTAQDEGQVTYVKQINKEDAQIDWSRSAQEIDRMVRAYVPWPVAYTSLDGKQLRLFKTKVLADSHGGKPGEVVHVGRTSLEVACGEGSLSLLEVQVQGKKPMPVASFLNGARLSPGQMVGEL